MINKLLLSLSLSLILQLQLLLLLQLHHPPLVSSFAIITPRQRYTTGTQTQNQNQPTRTRISTTTTKLHSLKPAAIPLLDSGKALARSGELLIEYTSTSSYKLYGGGLSSTGASIRNSGDCLAQAAASMRFKTAMELVCDELRESSTCILEGSKEKLIKGVDDANLDGNDSLAEGIKVLIPFMEGLGVQLESAGEKIMKRDTIESIGLCLVDGSDCLNSLALGIQRLGGDNDDTNEKENDESIKTIKESGTRMLYAAEKMKEAGNNLMGVQPVKKKGKAWLKA